MYELMNYDLSISMNFSEKTVMWPVEGYAVGENELVAQLSKTDFYLSRSGVLDVDFFNW